MQLLELDLGKKDWFNATHELGGHRCTKRGANFPREPFGMITDLLWLCSLVDYHVLCNV